MEKYVKETNFLKQDFLFNIFLLYSQKNRNFSKRLMTMKKKLLFFVFLLVSLQGKAQQTITWDSDIDSVTLAYPIIFVDGVEIGDEDMAKIDTADVVSINILKDGPIYDLVAPRTGKIVMVKTKSKIFLKQWLLRKQFINDMYKRKQEKTHQKGIVIR